MAKTVFTGSRIFAGGADLTSSSNKCEINAEVEDKDVTTYGSSGWNEVIGGLKSGELKAGGFWEAADDSKVDNASWSNLGGANVPYTVGPTGASIGDTCYFMRGVETSYKLFGEVGEVAPWETSATSNWPVVRGTFYHAPGTARTSTGTGSATLGTGAVTTGKALYGALHVLSASGTTPSLTVTVESDDNSGFTSPTTVITFTAATAITSEILRSTTVSADTYYRIKWTISGTSPSFTFVVALGVA